MRAANPECSEDEFALKVAAVWLPDALLGKVLARRRARELVRQALDDARG